MNKKFKLTDKVTKESIRSPEFKRWLMRTLAVVCIISLIFQFSTCVYQGFNAYAAEDDSIVGTWVFNDDLNYDGIDPSQNHTVYVDAYYVNSSGDVRLLEYIVPCNANYYMEYKRTDVSYVVIPYTYNEADSPTKGWRDNDYKTLIFNRDVDDIIFKSWLKANATKVVEEVYDFTNEIRVFNDELTFFITDQASWVEVFYFDYEILGLGVCDYLSLQRTTSNEYLMRYNVLSDGADGYLHTSYRYYVAQSRGGFLRDNYKTIRFITNPENTDFQQWLLDNTTLIGTADDQETYDYIYDMGFNVGYNSGYEQGFANSLIGDTLSGPINALSSITLIQIGDTVITLGGVIMTAIALCLVLAFLKLYAGG